MKQRFGHALVWVFLPLYAWLGEGCFWRERGHDRDVYVEHRHVDHDEHEHEHEHDHGHGHEEHEDKHDHDRH